METEYLRIRDEAIYEATSIHGRVILEDPAKEGKTLARKPFRQHGLWYVRVRHEYLVLQGYSIYLGSNGLRYLLFTLDPTKLSTS